MLGASACHDRGQLLVAQPRPPSRRQQSTLFSNKGAVSLRRRDIPEEKQTKNITAHAIWPLSPDVVIVNQSTNGQHETSLADHTHHCLMSPHSRQTLHLFVHCLSHAAQDRPGGRRTRCETGTKRNSPGPLPTYTRQHQVHSSDKHLQPAGEGDAKIAGEMSRPINPRGPLSGFKVLAAPEKWEEEELGAAEDLTPAPFYPSPGALPPAPVKGQRSGAVPSPREQHHALSFIFFALFLLALFGHTSLLRFFLRRTAEGCYAPSKPFQ